MPEQLTGECSLNLRIGEVSNSTTHSNVIEIIDQCLSDVSNKLTLKTGDLVFIASDSANSVKEGDNINVTINNTTTLNFQIK